MGDYVMIDTCNISPLFMHIIDTRTCNIIITCMPMLSLISNTRLRISSAVKLGYNTSHSVNQLNKNSERLHWPSITVLQNCFAIILKRKREQVALLLLS